MANIKSAKKRIKVINKKTQRNRITKSIMKTAIRRFNEAVEAGDVNLATEKFRYAEKKICQAAAKNTIHKNNAARKISKLAKKLQQLKEAAI
ncbi:30S ribosomal protein S20 [Paramaledivibacter caminithermalis]|uniref:Small ribosomal subunit protein bS20 n=1 Tax=Paramaledivibacter caminithermalis (strain DSM 15212 / CIP 107654 / DViRD3) TaxID=1121301 RepID=A0A1M6M6C1_PARC5|nr:30S ribosomal protein S20 [Paramaledivibacter caminithermalis]SHJ79031.1 small subunit ribosomal protein S20 [Paramaledivibacter caminithermalis DSM 15212]